MSSRLWATSEDLSTDSRAEAGADVSRGRSHDESVEEVQTQGKHEEDEQVGTVARHFATSMRLPALQPQEHASLFYLSLIEGRCRTQAAKNINAKRSPREQLAEDHPEVYQLAEVFFSEMKRELVTAGLISEDIARRSLLELRQYLNSFDTLLNNLAATTQNRNITTNFSANGFSLDHSSLFAFSEDASGSQRGALIRRPSAMAPANTSPLPAKSLQGHIEALFKLQAESAATGGSSLFYQNYQDINQLGEGGFGSVYRARYILDGQEWALKKITFSGKDVQRLMDDGNLDNLLSEVKVMAALFHPNVVRYQDSWFEAGFAQDSDSESDDESNAPGYDEDRQIVSFRLKIEKSVIEEIDQSRAIFAKSVEIRDEDPEGRDPVGDYSDSNSTSSSNPEYSRFFPPSAKPRKTNDSGKTEDIEVVFEEDDTALVGPMSGELVDFDGYLFIKMPIYPMSLHAYVWGEEGPEGILAEQPRHCFHPLPTARLLLGILNGVMYLHRNKIVHRDLKPANIFLEFPQPADELASDEEPPAGFINTDDCPKCRYKQPLAVDLEASPPCQQVTTSSQRLTASSQQRKPRYIRPCVGDFGLIHKLKDIGGDDGPEDPSKSIQLHPGKDVQGSAQNQALDQIQAPAGVQVPFQTQNQGQVGTLMYIPPRMLATSPICPKVDVYGLGVIAFELSCPFTTVQDRNAILKVLRADDGEDNYPDTFKSNPLYELVEGMMRHDRDKRWSCQEVRAWLKNYLNPPKHKVLRKMSI